MLKLIIEIETDTDAFKGENFGREINRILKGLGETIHQEGRDFVHIISLHDRKGNRVGRAQMSDER